MQPNTMPPAKNFRASYKVIRARPPRPKRQSC